MKLLWECFLRSS